MTHDSKHANSHLIPMESQEYEEIEELETGDDDYQVHGDTKLRTRYDEQSGKTPKPLGDDYDVSESPDLRERYRKQKLESSKNNYIGNRMPLESAQFVRRLHEHKSTKIKNKNDEIEADSGSPQHATTVDSKGTCVNSMTGGCKSRVEMEKESIKKHLLSKLGMDAPPPINKNHKLSEEMTRIFCEKYNISEEACFGSKVDYQSDGIGYIDTNSEYSSDEAEDDASYQYAETRQRITTFPRCEYEKQNPRI